MSESPNAATHRVVPCPGAGAAATQAAVWAGVAALLEAASQLLRFGAAGAPVNGGWAALLTAPVLPAAVTAAGLALLFSLPAGLVRGRRRAPAAAGAALATLAAVAAAYLLREHGPAWLGREHRAVRWLLVGAGWLVATRLLSALLDRPAAPGRLPRCRAAAGVLLAAGAIGWWAQAAAWREARLGGIPLGEPRPGAPDVVLVTVDTWRADHDRLPDGPPGSPLAAVDGLVALRDTWSSASWTLPSMATLLTGWPPRVLGVARYRGLPAGVETLAGIARRAGYDTWAVAANPYLAPEYGFARGFARYDHARRLEWLLPAARSVLVRELTARWEFLLARDDAAHQVGRALRWLRSRRRQRPVFLWVHLMDPHLPYRRHRPADFPPSARQEGRTWCAPPPPAAAPFTPRGLPASALPAVRERCPDLPDSLAVALRRLYAGEVAYAEAWVAELLRYLREHDRWDRTLLVLTADHGEELLDHGGYEHGHSLLPEVTRVPFYVHRPGASPARRALAGDRRTLDLVPTLCRELGWTPPAGLPGRPRLWDPADSTRGAVPPAVMENMLYGPSRLGLRLDRWLRLTVPDRGDSVWYDLRDDPACRRPLPAAPAGADALLAAARRRLVRWDSLAAVVQGEETDGAVVLDAQLRRRLRSLGY